MKNQDLLFYALNASMNSVIDNSQISLIRTDGIGIVLFPDSHPDIGGLTDGVRAIASGKWDNIPTGLSGALIHEMGHVFGLHHTHHNCEYGGNWHPIGDVINCNYAGDYMCDTPMDPGINFNVDENCNWTRVAPGENFCDMAPEPIENYNPSTSNFMAYVPPRCMTEFKNDQAFRMRTAINSWHRARNYGNNPLPLPECNCNAGDVIVTSNTNINFPLLINGNIYIKSSATLTITNKLILGQDKKIIIEDGGKLILSGEKCVLDKCDSASKWDGIIIQSGGILEVEGATIHNATKAIYAQHSSTLDIDTISIYGQSKFTGSGIFIDGNVNISNLNNITIQNYREGIFAYNGVGNIYNLNGGEIKNTLYAITFVSNSIIISDFEITNTSYGIMIYNGPGSTISHCIVGYTEYGILANWSPLIMVNYCTIGLTGQIGKVGMSFYQSGDTKILHNPIIQATNLGIRLWSSQATVEYNSINLFGTNNQYGGGVLTIDSHNSVIEENYLDINQSAFGIETNISTGTKIQNNQIDHFSSISTRTAAIRSMGSMDETIKDNIINGVANTTGIIAQNTTSNQYLCNIIDNTHEGLGVYYNAEMQNIRGNEIDAWTDLALRSQVGPQVHHGNKFVGGKARADELNSDEIAGSQFFVNSSIPYLMPTDILPSSDWFINQANANAYTCTGTQGPSWTPFNGGGETEVCAYWNYLKSIRTAKPEMFFVKLYHLLKYAKTKSGFVLPDCVKLDPLFQSVCGITKLMDVAVALHKMGTSPVNASNLNTLQVQYGLQTTDAGRASVKNQIQTELALIVPILDTKAAADTIKLDSLTTELNTISCTSVIVSKWKDIFKLYVKFLKTGEVAVADRPTLVAYSSECSDIYGDAIHMARAMANTYDNTYFDAYDVCITPTTPRSIKTSEVATAISVHPNPTSGILYLNLPDNYTGHVAVRDIDGKVVYEKDINAGNLTNIDLTMYSGVYFVVFTSETGDQSVHKVILIK